MFFWSVTPQLATFPGNASPRHATNAGLSFAAAQPVDHADLVDRIHRATTSQRVE